MVELLLSLTILVFAAWLVRRLLGIERGRWMATLAAVFVAEICAVLVIRVVFGDLRNLPPRAYIPIYALVAVFAMIVIAMVELIAGPRRRRRRGPGIPHPIRGVRRLIGRTVRYAQVSTIAVHRGLIHPGSGGDEVELRGTRLGRSLAAAFGDAGGLFVKLGQAMAAQPHLVTRAVAADVARLQDQAAPADPAAARAVIEEELGPVEPTFAELSTTPLGSASIAQT